ncbi:hypothetical protein KKG41_05425, partial [Patescibacteria group bacterium]|nr:hypothetical protein [Patescibacteria group bacterium]MBU1890690.1 hypothetical protein [Patescibacteria group bacterium]
KSYIRYTDDFIIVADNKPYLENLIPRISTFLRTRLKLTLHPKKVTIHAFHQGIDFLGYVVFAAPSSGSHQDQTADIQETKTESW